jgi:hypothetical protein
MFEMMPRTPGDPTNLNRVQQPTAKNENSYTTNLNVTVKLQAPASSPSLKALRVGGFLLAACSWSLTVTLILIFAIFFFIFSNSSLSISLSERIQHHFFDLSTFMLKF